MDILNEMKGTLCDSQAEELLSVFREKGLTFACAESCTGGLVSTRLTAVAGSSDVVLGGVVSYSNSVKNKVLGVMEETLMSFGAVSVETAVEMAEGVRRITGADIAVSITGIAGPGGGSELKPVGTVCFGVAFQDSTESFICHFDSKLSRSEIRRMASDYALSLAKKTAENEVYNA